jgi:hypothetical protein
MAPQTHLPPNWRQRVLAGVNGHGWLEGAFAAEALRLLDAWARAEGGLAQWNPLNTTLKLYGSTPYNAAGVQSYVRPTEGVCATVLTLVNGHYAGILGDLQGGLKPAEQIVRDRADEFRTWGTDPGVLLAVLGS